MKPSALFLCAGVLTASAVAVSQCGGSSPTSPPSSPGQGSGTGAPSPPVVLAGAGDIGLCGSTGVAATAQLLDRIPGIVFTTGDNAYPNGSAANFRDCYEPHWGRHKDRTLPTPGNHDYETPGGAGYYNYFGSSAGPSGLGYYSYDAGSWHVIALNSEIPVSHGSAQLQWLRADLQANRSPCTAAYWHRPLFTSGPNGPHPQMRDLWQTLYDFNADLIITGHDHLYERFAPQDPNGRHDPARGIRQITIGTGGGPLYTPVTSAPHSERLGSVYGILKLTLADGSYQWEFVPVPGASFSDAGQGTCH
jgi:hypothetical protein